MDHKRYLTKQMQIEEILKCAKDPIYFITTYLEIQHPDKGRLPFKLYSFQEDVIKALLKNRFNIVLKSRQLGLSTSISAYALWLAVFHRDKTILFVANKLETAKGMVQKIRIAWQSLPSWMLNLLKIDELEAESVKYIKFSNGCSIKALPNTPDAGRGEAASLVVVDEAAIIEDLAEMWRSLYSTVQTGGSIVVFSTPYGKGGQFHKLWTDSEQGKNDFNRIELPWHVHPDHDQAWFDTETRNMEETQINQELLCSFESSSHTFFTPDTIQFIRDSVQGPIGTSGPSAKQNTDLWIWKTPVEDHQYIIAADVASGNADDYSAFHVYDTNESEIVAEYMGKLPPDRFGEYLAKVGEQYNKALLIPEKNTIGLATAIKLRDIKYPNLYYEKKEELYLLDAEEQEKVMCGLTINVSNRDKMLNNLEECLRNKKIRVYSQRFVDQLETFIWKGKRAESIKRKFDDLIISLAIGCWIHKPTGNGMGYNVGNSNDWSQAFLKSISRRHRTTADIGYKPQQNPFGGQQEQQTQQLGPVEYYKGKKLPPGVKKEQVELYERVYGVFDWLFK